MIPVPIHNIYNLHRRPLQRALHCPSRFHDLGIAPRRRQRHVQHPRLPDQLVVCLAPEPAFASLFLQELDDYLAAAAGETCCVRYRGGAVGRDVELPGKGRCALVNEGFELDVVDDGEGHVEEVVGFGL